MQAENESPRTIRWTMRRGLGILESTEAQIPMEKTQLGRTGLMVTRTAFGALPIQRVDFDTARHILRRAYDAGINFYDTAIAYSDSHKKIGYALSDVRENIVIATKTPARDRKTVHEHIAQACEDMKTDYLDILQLHNPGELPDPDDPESAYTGLVEARDAGKIRHIGISNHRRDVAREAVESGLYETLQFPLSAISLPADLALIDLCREHNVGVIAMKALSGGLLTDATRAFAFLRQYENVVPIWGIQHMSELDEFLALDAAPPVLDDAMLAAITKDREELAGNFCRACGYCMPCPQGINIPVAARITLMMRRMPSAKFYSAEFQKQMELVKDCTGCRQCAEACPYELDTPALLEEMYDGYREMIAASE